MLLHVVWQNFSPLNSFSCCLRVIGIFFFMGKINTLIIPKVIKTFNLIACFTQLDLFALHNEDKKICLVSFPPDLLLRNFVHMALFNVWVCLLYIQVTQLLEFKRPWRLRQNGFHASTYRIVRFRIAVIFFCICRETVEFYRSVTWA